MGNTHEQIRVLRTRTEIEPLRSFWQSCSPGRDTDLDYFLFIIELYSEALRPHVVVLYDQDVPKVLLAGRVDESRIRLQLGGVGLPTPKLRIIQFVYGGLLGQPSSRQANLLIQNVMKSLEEGEADVAFFHYFEIESPLAKAATSLPSRFCSDNVIITQPHWLRNLAGQPDTFLSGLSQNERYQQRKRTRKIEQHFPNHRIETFRRLDELDQMMGEADAIAKKSYQRGLGVGFSQTAIIRGRLEFEANKGWLHSSVLYLNDRPSAFWIASLRDRVFLSDYLAFDPTYSDYAPGMYLVMKVIEHLGDNVQCIDFGGGDALYKQRLSNYRRDEAGIYIFAPQNQDDHP